MYDPFVDVKGICSRCGARYHLSDGGCPCEELTDEEFEEVQEQAAEVKIDILSWENWYSQYSKEHNAK